MNMEGMRHAERKHLPYFGCSDLDALVDPRRVVRFSIYAHDTIRAHMHFVSLIGGHAHAAIENELPPSDRSRRIGRGRFDKACGQVLNGRMRPGRLEPHHRFIFAIDAALGHGAERTQLFIRASLQRHRPAIREVNEDFETLAGRVVSSLTATGLPSIPKSDAIT